MVAPNTPSDLQSVDAEAERPVPLGWWNPLSYAVAGVAIIAATTLTMANFTGDLGANIGAIAMLASATLAIFGVRAIGRMVRGSTTDTTVSFGTDGVQVFDEFVPWNELNSISIDQSKLILEGISWPVLVDDPKALAAILESRRDSSLARAEVSVPRQLRPPQKESYVQRDERLRQLRTGGYRSMELQPEQLVAIIGDGRLSDDDRLAATVVVTTCPPRFREQARAHIAGMANEDLRFVLEAALDNVGYAHTSQVRVDVSSGDELHVPAAESDPAEDEAAL